MAAEIWLLTVLLGALLLAACGAVPPSGPACLRIDGEVRRLDRSAMVRIPEGDTIIGSTRFQPEEAPVRRVHVRTFWIDRHEVTNAEFAAFVRATGYRTAAERSGGGAVFHQPDEVTSNDMRQWWRIDPIASWRRPHGASGPAARPDEPVVQVTIEDARAYAHWRGRTLPTEEEWERAARGGLADADFSWGNDRAPAQPMANHWDGPFPVRDIGEDGYRGVAPVGCFPANGYGLYDMAGNVWELTSSAMGPGGRAAGPVIKGGSWLCADNYCLRYRPAARQMADPSLGTDHIGFRTAWREAPS